MMEWNIEREKENSLAEQWFFDVIYLDAHQHTIDFIRHTKRKMV